MRARGVRRRRASSVRGTARVEQVLDNLLSNAIDASPRDAQIVVAVRGWAELHVVDEGPGLTAEQRARAFDRFWRASNEPGSGLGLAIAKRLVELDGGEIELRGGRGRRHRRRRSLPRRQRCRPDRVLISVPVATMTRTHAGFTGVVQHEWPRPRGWVAAATRRRARHRHAARRRRRRSRSGCARSASRRCSTCSSTGRGATSSPSTRSRSRSSGATRRLRSPASSRTCARGASAAGARS